VRRAVFFLIFPVVFGLDFFSKQYAWEHPEVFIWNSGIGIELYLHYLENRGAAWGMFAHYSSYLFWLRVVAILLLGLYLIFGKLTRWKSVALSLLIAGALCNVIDFMTKGYVVDMIHFLFWDHSYGVFNIADTAIFLGIVGLMVKQKQQKKKPCLSRAPSK
jgi:signal peptidase II